MRRPNPRDPRYRETVERIAETVGASPQEIHEDLQEGFRLAERGFATTPDEAIKLIMMIEIGLAEPKFSD